MELLGAVEIRAEDDKPSAAGIVSTETGSAERLPDCLVGSAFGVFEDRGFVTFATQKYNGYL